MKRLIVGFCLLTSVSFTQNIVECAEGQVEELGEDMDMYYRQINSCRFKNILIMDLKIEDAGECKFTCHDLSYFLIDADKEVSLQDLFNDRKNVLLSRINRDLQKDFNEIRTQNEECFDGVYFEKVSFEQLSLFISDFGFQFVAESGVPNYCKGPAGEIVSLISFTEINEYLK